MDTAPLPGTDLAVSPLCYGTANIGTDIAGDDADRLFDAFHDAGGNFFDTAHVYQAWKPGRDGASEVALGAWLARRGCRDVCVIATKGGHPSMKHYRTVDRYLAPHRIEADVDDSLGRLAVETIDLYWLHRDDTRETVEDILTSLNREVKRGRVRYLGASNWTVERIEQANRLAADNGLAGFVASQPSWSLGQKTKAPGGGMVAFGPAEAAWHGRTQVAVIPYSSTAQGYFATAGAKGQGYDNDVSRARLARAQQAAERLGATPNQVALAWLRAQPFPVYPILGTTKPDHLADAVGSLKLKLTPAQAQWLETGQGEAMA